MRILKKMIAAVLCAAMAVSLFAGLGLHASAASTYYRTELEKIVADTAIAYYLKGPDCQYDSFVISGLSRTKTGLGRQTVCVSPEEASPQKRYYTVCSSFPNDVYYNVFGVSPLLPADLAGAEESSGNATIPEKTGLPVENLTDKDLENPIGMISLTATFCAYGKKVARIGDTNSYERGWIGHDFVAFFWGDNSFDAITDAELAELKNNLRPGDILSAVKGDEEDEDGENGGHTMMFLGDYKGDGQKYIIHATGSSKYNNNDTTFLGTAYSATNSGAIRAGVWTDDGTASGNPILGYDRVESASSSTRNGVIAISTFDSLIGRGKTYGPGSSGESVIKQFAVLRPIDRLTNWSGAMSDVSDNDLFPKKLTNTGYARMRYPGLEITTVADKNQNNDVQAGGTLTYSIIVENDTNLDKLKPRYGASGTTDTGMVLTMKLPTNASYVSHTVENNAASPVNGTVGYNAEKHAVVADGFTSAPGKTYRLNVTVQIDPAAQLGDKVILPAGGLTGPRTSLSIRTAEMSHVVGGAHPAGFGAITESSVTASGTRNKMDAANDVYAAAGYKLNLPDTQTLLNSVLTYTYQPSETSRRMQSRLLEPEEILDPDSLLLRRMVVQEYIGGRKLFTTNAAGVKTNRNRMLDFDEEYLQPGDILVYAYTATSATNSYSENTGRAILSTLPEAERVYVYLGDSNYAYYDDDGAFRVIHAPLRTFQYTGATPKGELTGFDRNGNTPSGNARIEWSAVLTQAFRYSYFLCLRPSQAYASLPVMTPSSSTAYTVTSGGATAGYASLDAALDAANANAGSTLYLRGDAALTGDKTFFGGTLDLGGHTLTTGDHTLTLGSGSSAQTLQNGTVTGNGTAVFCADSSVTSIRDAELFGGTGGAALASSDAARVDLSGVVLGSADTSALPVRTGAGGRQTNWTFEDDVTVIVPSGIAASYDGNGAALAEGVKRYSFSHNAYYQFANAGSAATYRTEIFTGRPAAVNETTGTEYGSMSAAITNATAGDTLRLLRDLRSGDLREIGSSTTSNRQTDPSKSGKRYGFTITKDLTVDFDGHTVCAEGRGGVGCVAFFIGSSSIAVTLKNGTIVAKNDWGVNTLARELHLDNMKVFCKYGIGIVVSDSGRNERTLYLDHNSLVVGGLGGSSGRNNAIELRHGSVVVRGGSKLGSITGPAVQPDYNSATAENPNTSAVIVEDGTLFTGRYGYDANGSDYGYFYTGYDHTKNNSTLTFLADSDTHYVREQHKEEVIPLLNSTAIVAVDRTMKYDDDPGMKQSMSLNLNDKLVINYYLEGAAETYTDDSYALVDGERAALVKEDGNLYLTVRESAAKEMGKESTVQAFCRDGAGVFHRGRASTLSIRGYAETILGATDWEKSEEATLGRAMIAMLDYGAAAQAYFGFETDDLANKNLTGADRARMTYTGANVGEYRTDKRTVNDPEGLYAASSCVLGSSQALRFYLNLPESRADRESLGFRVDYYSYRGEKRTRTLRFAELTESDTPGVYYLEVSDLRAADILTNVTLTMEKNESAIATVTDSVASYCARVQREQPETAALADALLIYGLSARAHFGIALPAAEENEMPVN